MSASKSEVACGLTQHTVLSSNTLQSTHTHVGYFYHIQNQNVKRKLNSVLEITNCSPLKKSILKPLTSSYI